MAAAEFDGWIIGREDMYQGEEVPAGDERLAYLSGFTGSAGFAVVRGVRAGLCSDGRYSLQMPAQTNSTEWDCNTTPDVTCEDWLKAAGLASGAIIAIDGRLVTVSAFRSFEKSVLAAGGTPACHHENLLDHQWHGRPALPPAAS